MRGTNLVPFHNLLPRREDLFAPFENYFNKIFNEFFTDTGMASVKGRSGYPKIDVLTQKGKWIVEVAAPGASPEDITVEMVPCQNEMGAVGTKRALKISGRVSEDHQYGQEADFIIKELRRSSFERLVILPDHIQGEPEATMKDGILTLVWHVTEPQEPERKFISIKKG